MERNKRWKGIEEWIQNTYLDESQMEQVDLLALAVCRMYKPEMALPILKQGFDLRPPMTAYAIGKIGGLINKSIK